MTYFRNTFLISAFLWLLVACTEKRTDHLLKLDKFHGISIDSPVLDADSRNEIGKVTEIISNGDHFMIEIDESYLKYPAAEFSSGFSNIGEPAVIARKE